MPTKKRLIVTTMRTIQRLRDPYYQGSAAEIGFYFIFSLVPILTLFLQLLGFFDVTSQLITEISMRFSSNEMILSLISAVQSVLKGKLNLVFILAALWSASKIEFSLIRIANYTFKMDGGNHIVGYFKSRLRAVVTIAIFIAVSVCTLLIFVYGQVLLEWLNSLLSNFLHIKVNADWLFSMLRWPILLFVYVFALMLNYSFLPNKRIPLKDTIPGSLFASVSILVATLAYSIYFQYFSNINLIYGSLASIIALMLWLYCLSFILILGMLINASWHEQRRDSDY